MTLGNNLILGINTGHDSGVTLIQDNQIIFSENEERISRIKGFTGFPLQTLQHVQNQFDFSKVEVVAIAQVYIVQRSFPFRYTCIQKASNYDANICQVAVVVA